MHLVVGVFDDEQCRVHGVAPAYPHVERCEVLRHCRWVDEVVPDAPWRIDEAFLSRRRIDYVAFEEGATVDPKYDSVRVKGYDEVKHLGEPGFISVAANSDCWTVCVGKVILTRKTTGLTVPQPALARARFLSSTPTPPVVEEDDYSPPPPLPLPLVPEPIKHDPVVEVDSDDDGTPPADLFL